MVMSADVLSIGLSPELVTRLASQVVPARVQSADVDNALNELERDRYSLLVIDAKSGVPGLLLLQHIRTSPELQSLPVIYVMDQRTEGIDKIVDFIGGLGIQPVAYADDLTPVVEAARPALGLDGGRPPPDPEIEPDGAASGRALQASDGWPLLLIADADARTVEALEAEATSRRIRTTAVSSLAQAREQLNRQRPAAVLLDLALPANGQDRGITEAGIELLDDLHRRTPPIPALVLTGRDSFGDRAAVVSRGARGFLQKPMPAAEVLDAVVQLLEPEHPQAGKVMVVNNDPIILRGLEGVLAEAGVLTVALGSAPEDVFRVWDVFERFVPDLLILDLDMPGMRAIDLCRIVRLDPRWTAVPILFLTETRDAEVVRGVFAAGGDDYVSKGSMSPDLVEKVSQWLRRMQWYRTMADIDPLTRLANRRGGRQVLERFLGTARRHGGRMAVAVLDIDNFKRINDTIGHAEGDEVLRQVAERLRRTFQRPTDVIVRWGGEEILIGMQDTGRQDAARLLRNLLGELQEDPPLGPDREPVTFSAGVAEYPSNGADLYELYLAADDAMYRAKANGKNQVEIAVSSER